MADIPTTVKRFAILIIFSIFGSMLQLESKNVADSVRIYYVIGHRYVNPSVRDNAASLQYIIERINSAVENERLDSVSICSGASPDGNNRANLLLSERRVDSLSAYILRHSSLSADKLKTKAIGVDWNGLRRLVAASDMPSREMVLDIIDNVPLKQFDSQGRLVDGRKKRLMSLERGEPYRYMLRHFFPDLRSSAVVVVYVAPELPEGGGTDSIETDDGPAETVPPADKEEESSEEARAIEVQESVIVPVKGTEPVSLYEYRPQIKLKTNAVAWAMLIANAAVEIDVHKYLSVNIPVYYSGINYFKQDIKFRILAFQPELRVWPLARRRFFAAVHFGVAYYNFALGGDWRIQDKGGKTPTWGGGLNVGYRLPLSDDGRWNVEFSVGGGVYDLNYDRFYNVPNGSLESTRRKVFWGVDNVAVSFSYSFNLKRQGK